MKRLLPFLLALILMFGCSGKVQNTYRHSAFTALVPEPFEPIENSSVLCFAPYGDPLLSSSITFSDTELNWYFDSFTKEEYEDSLRSLCGYETLTIEKMDECSVDGYDARRIACKVPIDQGVHDLIIYVISADRTYFFTLLNREGDDYIGAFDSMISTLKLTEGK